MQSDWSISIAPSGRCDASAPVPDPVLRPFLSAQDTECARRCLAPLLRTVAEPVIRAALRRRFRGSWLFARKDVETLEDSDREEVRSDILARILHRLWEARRPDAELISDFRAYVAVTAYRACDQRLMERYPERTRLKSRLRSLLENTPGLALWAADHRWLAGFSAWQAGDHPPDRSRALRRVTDDPTLFVREIAPGEHPDQMPPGEMLARLLDWVGHPVHLEDLVGAFGALWGVQEMGVFSLQTAPDNAEAERETVDPAAGVEDVVGLRDLLLQLWREIRELPLPQRAALLLNLRGEPGRDALPLFPIVGVATRAEIAEVLGMDAESFAALWRDLPLDDAAIAHRLGCTRQQVIGLRDCAKRRLLRRLHALEQMPERKVRSKHHSVTPW